MTSRDKPNSNDTTAGKETVGKEKRSSSGKAATSLASEERERHFLDVLEDDEVKEALRLSHRPRKRSITTKST